MKRLLALTLISQLALAPASAGPAVDWPLQGYWVRKPVIPEPNWQAGHRGLDIAADAGSDVQSPVSGRVTWVGEINFVPSITIQDGAGRKHSLLPVRTKLKKGQDVWLGDTVGTLAVSGHCFVACLHWGVRSNGHYVDPRWLLPPAIWRLPNYARG